MAYTKNVKQQSKDLLTGQQSQIQALKHREKSSPELYLVAFWRKSVINLLFESLTRLRPY